MRARGEMRWFAKRISDTWFDDPPAGFLTTKSFPRRLWLIADRIDDFARAPR